MNEASRRSVLHVGKYYPPVEGGIENHVASLCSGLSAHYEVTALVFNTERGTRREVQDGVRVVRAGSLGQVFSTEIAPSFLGAFRRLRGADIVHLHVPNPVGELACLSLPRSTPLVVTYHSDVVRQKLLGRLNRVVLHRVLGRADRVIVFTRRYLESSPVLRHHADRCAIIPHGIDLEEMDLTPAARQAAIRLRAEHGDRIAVFVGRLVYYKGVNVLLRAMALVPDARLLIVGDGPMRRTLEDLCHHLGLDTRVRFLGSVPHEEKVAACHAGSFLVLPATHRSEAFGLVQVEAMAASRPIICTNIDSGVPWVNADGRTGLVVEPGDHEALAAAMRRLFGDAELCHRFGEAARRRAEELFSREIMIRDSMALYDDVISRRSPRRHAVAGPVTLQGE
ncbi:MAG: glycosyltransferase [Candidatus Polarisedimenticolia bacterium]